ncbi:MAG TPA: SH3 domain-containing C40 family peptidase [Acetivibrio clariflavus]|nr:SH3 domain-containing C40 family peptidase [Acetivibrio clariflavus]
MFKCSKLILCSAVLNFSIFFTFPLSHANFDNGNTEQKNSNLKEYSVLSYNIENLFKDSNTIIEENIGPWYKIVINGTTGWVHKDLFPVEVVKDFQDAKVLAEANNLADNTNSISAEEEQENSEIADVKNDETTNIGQDVSEETNSENSEGNDKKEESVAVLFVGMITGGDVNIRKGPGTDNEAITQLNYGDKVEILGKSDEWYNVKMKDGIIGWVYGQYVSTESALASRGETSESSSSKRAQIVSYAKELLGVRYVYGGTTRSGFDCSGFVWHVFNHFGIKLNRVAADQAKQGTKISRSELQPGDLVFFDTNGGKNYINHVGIYIGNGCFIHASSGSKAKKVVISELNTGFYNDCFMTARKILD